MTPEDIRRVEQQAAYVRILTCTDRACSPSNHALCASCQPVFDAAFPDGCNEPDCRACARGAAEAGRAEQ